MIGIFEKKETTPRLTRLRSKVLDLVFECEYIKGEDKIFADAISRPKISLIRKKLENVSDMVDSIHEELGHPSVDVLHMFLKQNCGIEVSREKLKKLKGRCERCLKYDSSKTMIKPNRIPLKAPFDRVHVDVIGPLPRTEQGNRFVIVAVDSLTRWSEATATRTKTAWEVGKFLLKDIFSRHGAPNVLVSDQGTEFRNETVRSIC